MKKIILIISLLIVCKASYSQDFQIIVEPKVNLAMGAVGIINPALEVGISKHSAIQMEFFASFANEDFLGLGFPFLTTVGFIDYRYYIKGDMKGFFVGGSVGTGTWKMSRSMLAIVTGYGQAEGSYDVGSSQFYGVSVGYKFLFKERWGLEISATGGYVHGNHEGYNKHGLLVNKYNGTDEFLPYKGGIYLSYRIGGKKKQR